MDAETRRKPTLGAVAAAHGLETLVSRHLHCVPLDELGADVRKELERAVRTRGAADDMAALRRLLDLCDEARLEDEMKRVVAEVRHAGQEEEDEMQDEEKEGEVEEELRSNGVGIVGARVPQPYARTDARAAAGADAVRPQRRRSEEENEPVPDANPLLEPEDEHALRLRLCCRNGLSQRAYVLLAFLCGAVVASLIALVLCRLVG